MSGLAQKLLALSCMLFLALPLYAQSPNVVTNPNLSPNQQKNVNPEIQIQTTPYQPARPSQIEKKKNPFFIFLNKKVYTPNRNKQTKEDKEILRQEWQKDLGIDIFYPYFKAKEIEDLVSEKASVKIFSIKGRPKFSDDQIKYIFKVSF